MKLRNIIKGALLGVLALGTVSCADFLHRPLEDGYNTSIFYKTDEQVEMGINSLYNSPWYDFQRAFIWIGEIMSGNMYMGGSPYLTFTTNGSDEALMNMSYSLWAVNAQANTMINNIVASEGPSQAAKNKAIGEALTWKAMAYFYMVRTFGEVPIVHDNKEVLDSGTYNDLYKVTKEGVYEYIIMTLEKAMELLPKQTSGWNGRIDYYAAEGLLAKVYLTRAGLYRAPEKEEGTEAEATDAPATTDLQGDINSEKAQADLKKAAELAEDVILNSGRTLTPKYSDVFRMNPELYNQTGEHLIAWMWQAKDGVWTAQNSLQSDLGLKGFSGFDDVWGDWRGPSYDLALAFGADPLADPKTREGEKDTRRKATLMMAGDHYEYFWVSKGGFDPLYFLYSGDTEYAEWGTNGAFYGPCGSQCVKHLYGNKFDHADAVGYESKRMAYTLPTPLLRISDVYLVCAEASLLSGDAGTALTYVNKVRERAGADVLASVTFEDIWKERRLELAGEGDRWYDFVRRSYYDMDGVIAELKAQKRNALDGYDAVAKSYWYTGCGGTVDAPPADLTAFNADNAVWNATDASYNTTVPAPNVNKTIFTLPFPSEDVVFNPHLLEPAKDVDVRATYIYNF